MRNKLGYLFFASLITLSIVFSTISSAHALGQVNGNTTNAGWTTKAVGDFNGDGRDDIALWRSGWGSTPVYFSNGDNTFTITNAANPQNKNWINDEVAHKMVGDFNGDGRDDIALWKSGWGSTPVYFSDGDGTFTITNIGNGRSNWINDMHAAKMLGDFNGDGNTDIALWCQGWNSTPVYFSNGDGTFCKTNYGHPSNQNWINVPESRKIVGDFNGDGWTDIAFWREGWNSTPTYFSQGNGTFRKTNYGNPSSRNWINDSKSQKIVGDFNGDGRTDIALWREGWNSTPVYFSAGSGWFNISNYGNSSYQNWINDPTNQKLVGDFDGDGMTDIALRRNGWNSTPVYFSSGYGAFHKTNFLTSDDEVNSQLTQKVVGDFNADGKTDILVTVPGSQDAMIYSSSGSGVFVRNALEFQQSQNWINDPQARKLIGDYNGDGRTDIALQRLDWSSTPVYFSQSNGNLVPTNYNHDGNYNWINRK